MCMYHLAGLAGHVPGQSTMFIPLSRELVRSAREHKANGLAYSRGPANTNDLATPLPSCSPADKLNASLVPRPCLAFYTILQFRRLSRVVHIYSCNYVIGLYHFECLSCDLALENKTCIFCASVVLGHNLTCYPVGALVTKVAKLQVCYHCGMCLLTSCG